MRVDFQTVDVFTERRFGGNPLAVVLDARGLDADQMQSIAAEFNLAETTFVLPPSDPGHTARVRIFTPKAEMAFAGHPNVGTAYVLARAGEAFGRAIGGDRLVFEEIAGLVEIDLLRRDGALSGARLKAPQPFTRGADVSVETVAATCGLAPSDIATTHHLPCIAGCGNWFVFAELTSRAALAAAACNAEAFAQRLPMDSAVGMHLYVRTDEDGIDVQTRMFAPLYGVPEDPATGSANVALAGLLAALDGSARIDLRIAQGVDMGRPSLMEASARTTVGGTECYIGGSCVPVMRGEIDLG